MKEKINLTAIVKTFNSEKTILDTLESLRRVDEIIVLDENSSDDTIEILKEYKTKIIYLDKTEVVNAFQSALEQSKNDWIFYIEDDEIIPDKLLDEINSYITNAKKKKFCINLAKKVFYKDKELKSAKEKKELRLFKKDYIELEKSYSLQLKPKNTKVYSFNKNFKIKNGYILKFIKDDISTIILKTLETNRLKLKTASKKSISLFLKPFKTFIYFYFIKGGIFDFQAGLIYSMNKMFSEFIFETMLLEKRNNDI